VPNFTTEGWAPEHEKDQHLTKRHTKILIQKDEVVVWRLAAKPAIAWCPKCQRETRMVTPMQAALLCQVDQSRIQEWIQSGALHVSETPSYGLLICLTSLERS
jgi:hypothetical protein